MFLTRWTMTTILCINMERQAGSSLLSGSSPISHPQRLSCPKRRVTGIDTTERHVSCYRLKADISVWSKHFSSEMLKICLREHRNSVTITSTVHQRALTHLFSDCKLSPSLYFLVTPGLHILGTVPSLGQCDTSSFDIAK